MFSVTKNKMIIILIIDCIFKIIIKRVLFRKAKYKKYKSHVPLFTKYI